MINWMLRTAAACVAVGPALLVAPAAYGQSENPLVPLVDAAAQRLQVAEPVAATKFSTVASSKTQSASSRSSTPGH